MVAAKSHDDSSKALQMRFRRTDTPAVKPRGRTLRDSPGLPRARSTSRGQSQTRQQRSCSPPPKESPYSNFNNSLPYNGSAQKEGQFSSSPGILGSGAAPPLIPEEGELPRTTSALSVLLEDKKSSFTRGNSQIGMITRTKSVSAASKRASGPDGTAGFSRQRSGVLLERQATAGLLDPPSNPVAA